MTAFVPLVGLPAWTPLVPPLLPAAAEPRVPPGERERRRGGSERERQPAPELETPAVVIEVAPREEERDAEEAAIALAMARRAEARQHADAMAELHRLQGEARAEGERLARLAEGLDALRHELLAEVRAHAADLVLAAAGRVAGAALRTEPGLIEGLLEDALGSLGGADLVVRVSPEDEARVVRWVDGRPIRVVADPSVRAGCVASSPNGCLDASLDTALAALEDSALPFGRGR